MYTGKIELTTLQVEYLKATYPDTKNRIIAEALGISESSVHRWARKLGLVKTPEHIRRCQENTQRCAYMANKANGFEAQRRSMDKIKHLSIPYRYGTVVYKRAIYTAEMAEYIREHYATESAGEIAEHLGVKPYNVYNFARNNGLYKNETALKDIRQKSAVKARTTRMAYIRGEARRPVKVNNEQKMPPRAILWSSRLQAQFNYRLLGRFVFGIDAGTRRTDMEEELIREYGFVFRDLR